MKWRARAAKLRLYWPVLLPFATLTIWTSSEIYGIPRLDGVPLQRASLTATGVLCLSGTFGAINSGQDITVRRYSDNHSIDSWSGIHYRRQCATAAGSSSVSFAATCVIDGAGATYGYAWSIKLPGLHRLQVRHVAGYQ